MKHLRVSDQTLALPTTLTLSTLSNSSTDALKQRSSRSFVSVSASSTPLFKREDCLDPSVGTSVMNSMKVIFVSLLDSFASSWRSILTRRHLMHSNTLQVSVTTVVESQKPRIEDSLSLSSRITILKESSMMTTSSHHQASTTHHPMENTKVTSTMPRVCQPTQSQRSMGFTLMPLSLRISTRPIAIWMLSFLAQALLEAVDLVTLML